MIWQIAKRISIGLSAIVLVILCGALLLFNWPKTGWKALNVSTGSMRPTLPVGSLVLMHRVPLSSLKVGDVITYTNPSKTNTTITHRIIAEHRAAAGLTFITQGDANQSPDQPIAAGIIKGKVIWHTAHLGAWLNWTSKPYLLLPIIYIPALAIIIEELKRLSEYYSKLQPYVASGYNPPRKKHSLSQKLALSAKLSVFLVLSSFISVRTVHAALHSQATLTGNTIRTVANLNKCPAGNSSNTNISVTGSGTNNNNNVNVTNTTTQTSTTGNATSSGGGNATSGNASNTNCTTINVTITNNH